MQLGSTEVHFRAELPEDRSCNRRCAAGGFSFTPARIEVGALGDRQTLQVAAQAVEAELDRTQAHPIAAAIDARAGFDALLGGDREMDAAAEIDAVGAVVDLDQHRERVGCAGLPAHCARRPLRRRRRSDLDPAQSSDLHAILISSRSPAHNVADQYNAVFRFQSKNDAP
jgi:hypothetical protein